MRWPAQLPARPDRAFPRTVLGWYTEGRRSDMSKGFSLEIYPWAYRAKNQEDGSSIEEYIEKPHRTPGEEEALPAPERAELLLKRNNYADLPLVNFTSQYGMGCFEGLKAFLRIPSISTLPENKPDIRRAADFALHELLGITRFPISGSLRSR